MDTNRLKRFATEARNILMQGVKNRLQAIGFDLNTGQPTEMPQKVEGGAVFMGDTVTTDFYSRWMSLYNNICARGIKQVAEEAAYTWFNRFMAIRIMQKQGFISPVLAYESEEVRVPVIVSEARQGRMPKMAADVHDKLMALLDDDSKTNEQFALLIVAYCHENPIINKCFGAIADYTELLLPQNILAEGGFVSLLNNTPFISEQDFHSSELIGWLYQFYIAEKKDDVFASFKKGKKAEPKDIPAATQIFTPNWIVKYMVQNTVGRIYLDNNPYSEIKEGMQYLVESAEKPAPDSIFQFDDIHELTCADLACGSGHILNEAFDLLYQIYLEEGYNRRKAVEDIFRYNLRGIDLDTRAKQLAQFALLLKACQKDSSFADGHCMPRVMDMPAPYAQIDYLCDTLPHFFLGGNQEMVQETIEAFELMNQAQNLGSIMKFNISEHTRNAIAVRVAEYEQQEFVPEAIEQLLPYMRIILALTEKYATLVMNPPYMKFTNMNDKLVKYIENYYEEGKPDLYAVFMLVAKEKTRENGGYAMIVQNSWLVNSRFTLLRNILFAKSHLCSLLNMGRGNFGNDWGATAFVVANNVNKVSIDFFKLYERVFYRIEPNHISELFLEAKENHSFRFDFRNYSANSFCPNHADGGRRIYYSNNHENFRKIENEPICYTFDQKLISIVNGTTIADYFHPATGMQSGNNDKFIRLWYEVSNSFINTRWYPLVNGGNARKWYGNLNSVINWENNGEAIKNTPSSVLRNSQFYFKAGITWNRITSKGITLRYFPAGCIFDQAGDSMFKETEEEIEAALGYLNTNVAKLFFEMLSPTINLTSGTIKRIPYLQNVNGTEPLVYENITISKQDWDAHETSWDFAQNELLSFIPSTSAEAEPKNIRLSDLVAQYKQKWEEKFHQLHQNEEELNRQFIDIYGLQDELTPDVPLDEITILQQGEISIA